MHSTASAQSAEGRATGCNALITFCEKNDEHGLHCYLVGLQRSGLSIWRGRSAVQTCAAHGSMEALAALLRFTGTNLVTNETIQSMGLCTSRTLCVFLALRDPCVSTMAAGLGLPLQSTQTPAPYADSERLNAMNPAVHSYSWEGTLPKVRFAAVNGLTGSKLLGLLCTGARSAATSGSLQRRTHAACCLAFVHTLAAQHSLTVQATLLRLPLEARRVYSLAAGHLKRWEALKFRIAARAAARG